MSEGCLFCRIVAGEVPARIVHRDELVVGFEDINPGAPVHCLFVPVEHLDDVHAVEDPHILRALFAAAGAVARERGIDRSGHRLVFNVGPDAGQSVLHAHLHLLGGRGLGWPPG